MSVWNRMISTDDDRAAALARLALGLVMFPHGAQKVLGWFGGYGIQGTLGFLTGMGIPAWLAVLVLAAEFLGSLALIAGVAGRVGALGVIAVMIGAVVTTHWPNGFFMNWAGTQPGEGFEFHLIAIALSLVVVVKGSGAFSIDRLLSRGRARETPAARELARAA